MILRKGKSTYGLPPIGKFYRAIGKLPFTNVSIILLEISRKEFARLGSYKGDGKCPFFYCFNEKPEGWPKDGDDSWMLTVEFWPVPKIAFMVKFLYMPPMRIGG